MPNFFIKNWRVKGPLTATNQIGAHGPGRRPLGLASQRPGPRQGQGRANRPQCTPKNDVSQTAQRRGRGRFRGPAAWPAAPAVPAADESDHRIDRARSGPSGSDASRSLQRSLHARRRADGRRAAADRALGEHQGATRFLVRAVRRGRRARRECAAHARPPRVDGRQRGRGARGPRRRPAPWRFLPAQLAVPRRHAPARHDRRHAGVRRLRRAPAFLHRIARAPRGRRWRDAGIDAARQPRHRRGRRADPAGPHRPRRPVRRSRGAPPAHRRPVAGARSRAEPRRPARATRRERPRHPRDRARRRDARLAGAARVHGPRAGQRRGLHAPRDPPAARWPLRLRARRRPAHRRQRRDRPGGGFGGGRFHRYLRRRARTISTLRARSPWRRCCTCSAR